MEQKKRIEYLDAMRGFTMILVVYSHVHLQSFLGGDSFNDLFVMIRMPLFFFVSGFLLEKPNVIWKLNSVMTFLKKKFKIQIIPTFIFMFVYCYLFDINISSCLIDASKSGYWFTLTLFEYFLLYSVCKMLPSKWQLLLLFVFSFLLCAIKGLNLHLPILSALQLVHGWYFVFFSFGVFVKRNFLSFRLFLLSRWYSLVLGLFICGAICRIKGSIFNELPFQIIQVVILGVLGICVVFCFFSKYENSFNSNRRLGRYLQYVGKRTLDVYLLHFFFVPQNLGVVGAFFREYFNPILELCCSLLISIVIVGLCLVVSNLIRTSRILGHYLFGVKNN